MASGIELSKQPDIGAEPAVRARQWYMLVVLTACYTLAFLDSRLPLILVESIKADLRMSDTQMGVLVGPAFSVTYALAAIPIARLSDRHARKYVIGAAIAVWSIFTATAGAAHNFMALLFARTGLAVGESALTPAAHSMISDSFPVKYRARAIAVYSTGITLGMFMALALGGYINDHYGWRAAMFLVGGSGLFLSALIMLTVKEPARSAPAQSNEVSERKQTIRTLLADPVIRHTVIGGTLLCASHGATAWLPAYMIRNFAMTTSQVGVSFGAAAALSGLLGVLAGGFVNDWLAKRDIGWPFRFFAFAFAAGAALKVIALMMPTFLGFLFFICLSTLLLISYPGPTYGMIQSRVDAGSRSFASAVALFCLQGIGVSIGGLMTGWLSDVLPLANGATSLRWALVIVSLFSIWSGFHYFWAARHLAVARRAGDSAISRTAAPAMDDTRR
jgi:predicted MFS family arabinose efflux permease